MVDIANRTHLVVTQHTTAQDLKGFTDQLKDGQKVRAVKTERGTVLYAKDSKSSGAAKFFGVASRRRNLAKSTLRDVLSNIQQDVRQNAKGEFADNRSGIFDNLGTYGLTGHKTPKSETLKAIANTAFALHRSNPQTDRPLSELKISEHFGGKTGALFTGLTKDIEAFSKGLKGEPERKVLADKIADALKGAVEEKCGGDKKQALEFLGKEMPELRRDLKEGTLNELSKSLGPDETHALFSGPLNGIFNEAVDLSTIKLLDLPKSTNDEFKLGTKTFTLGNDIGQGGFGKVALLTSPGEDNLVVKFSTALDHADLTNPYSKTTMSEEYLRHMAAQGNPPHDNVIQVKGAFQLETGGVAMVMEAAPHGDFVDFTLNAKQALDDKLITPHDHQAIVLSLFRDAASGVADMQLRGITHSDLKADNLMIGKNGVGKVVDMGTVQVGGEFLPTNSSNIDSPSTLPPEVNRSNAKYWDVGSRAKNNKAKLSDQINKQILPLFHDSVHVAVKSTLTFPVDNIIDKKKSAEYRDWAEEGKGSPKIDTWQMGMALFFMATGNHLTIDIGMNAEIEAKVGEFPDGMKAVGEGGYFDKTTGNSDLDDLINQMLVSDPNKRPTMDVILRHDLLQDPSLNSTVIKDLIVDVSKGSPELKLEKQKIKDETDQLLKDLMGDIDGDLRSKIIG